MKMKRGLTLMLIAVLLFQLISAVDTQIIVKTIPYHKVDVRALNPADKLPISTFYKTSNLSGDVSVTVSTALDTFNVAVWVYEEKRGPENVIAYKNFEESYPSGTALNIELYPDGYVPPAPVEETPAENLTGNLTENITYINNTSAQKSITGSVSGIFSNNLVLYGAGVLVLLVIIGFLIHFFIKMKKKKYYKYGFKKNDWNSYKKGNKEDFYKSQNQKQEFQEEYSGEDELSEAERKIREAQETIRRIKNQGKMTELKKKVMDDKRKLIEDERELIKARGGKGSEGNVGNYNLRHQGRARENIEKDKSNPNFFKKEDNF